MMSDQPQPQTERIVLSADAELDVLAIPLRGLPAGTTISVTIVIGPPAPEPTPEPAPTRRYVGGR